MTDRMMIATEKSWDILKIIAKNKNTITYKELGSQVGYNAINMGRVLSPIQNYCLNNLIPPITALVVNKRNSGKPGYNYIIRNSSHSNDLHEVWNYNWENTKHEFKFTMISKI